MKKNLKLCVIGVGYVGLPLALEFSKKFEVIAYDINKERINKLNKGIDNTGIFNKDDLKKKKLKFTYKDDLIGSADVFIITVPTPVTKNKKPDLRYLLNATKKVANKIKENSYIIFESTVYPGLTEEICIPILEKISKFKLNKNLFVGYSPERVNPGDKKNNFVNIKKIVSGSDQKTLNFINKLYNSILKKGTFKAKSIKIAEAAKISENVQRDLNISLMNELSLIYSKMNIDTAEVLKAMKTKWNSLNFVPGLVGGHCISVDPYYLTYKSEKLGYKPEVIHSGRNVNELIPAYIIKNLLRILKNKNLNKRKIKVGIFGLTFKEDCKDFRNSKAVNIINELKKRNIKTIVNDPIISKTEFLDENKNVSFMKKSDKVDVVILTVPHSIFKSYSIKKIKNFYRNTSNPILLDIKSIYDKKALKESGFIVWSL